MATAPAPAPAEEGEEQPKKKADPENHFVCPRRHLGDGGCGIWDALLFRVF